MFVRRAFLSWQFVAVVVLPAAVFLSRGVFGASLGWDVLLSVLAAPVLGFALLVVAVLTVVRPSVRADRAVSWFDVAVSAAWHALIIWCCVQPSAGLVFAIGLAAAVAFWGAIWQLVTDAGRRLVGAVRDFGAEYGAAAAARRRGAPIDLGELRPVVAESGEARDSSPRSVAQ